jgi:hypothetical protein
MMRIPDHMSGRAFDGLAGTWMLLTCCVFALAWGARNCRPRRSRDRILLVLSLIAVAVTVRPVAGFSLGSGPLHGAAVFEVIALLFLARVTQRGPWILWTILVSAALTVILYEVRGRDGPVVNLAGPVAVALTTRVAVALRDRVTSGDADAALARLVRPIHWRPWRTAMITSIVAFVLAWSFWTALMDNPIISINTRRPLEIAFFAIPGPFTLLIAILFHALDREDSFVDRIACAVAPLVAVVCGLGGWCWR